MFYVATLISHPDRPAVTDDLGAKGRALSAARPRRSTGWTPASPSTSRFWPSEVEGRRRRRRAERAFLQGPAPGPPRHHRRRAGRRRRAAARRAPQEAAGCRHGFHHDRPGMHRRARRLCRPQEPRRGDHRARDARRDRVRAGVARARRPAQRPAGDSDRSGHRRAHPPDAGRPDAGRNDAGERRPYLRGVRRLHRLHVAALPR